MDPLTDRAGPVGVSSFDDRVDPDLRARGSFSFAIVELRDGTYAVTKYWNAWLDSQDLGEHLTVIWRSDHADISAAKTAAFTAATSGELIWDDAPNVTLNEAVPEYVGFLAVTDNQIYRPLTRRELRTALAAQAERRELYGADDDPVFLSGGRLRGQPRVDDRPDPDLRATGRFRFSIVELRDGTYAVKKAASIVLDSHLLADLNTFIWRGTLDELASGRAAAQRVAIGALRWNSPANGCLDPNVEPDVVRYVETTNGVSRPVTRRELRAALACRSELDRAEQPGLGRTGSPQPRQPSLEVDSGIAW